jgi:ELWxxDGT repeat protein
MTIRRKLNNRKHARSTAKRIAATHRSKLRLESLERRDMLALVPVMVDDINRDTVDSDATIGFGAMINSIMYYSSELWRSDGTEAGTFLVKDLDTGTMANGVPLGSRPEQFTYLNGTLLFVARVNDTLGLWKSGDGATNTAPASNNTVPLMQFSSNYERRPQGLTVVGDKAFFAADNGSGGLQLWVTDGTTTVPVRDTTGATVPIDSRLASQMVQVNGQLLFWARDSSGTELWRSDSVNPVAVQVTSLNSTGDLFPPSTPRQAVVRNLVPADPQGGDRLFFYGVAPDAQAPSGHSQLWVTDGTSGIAPSTMPLLSGIPSELTAVGQKLYFTFSDADGLELWESDGTVPGTKQAANIASGSANSSPLNITDVASVPYFTADAGAGRVLYRFNGTSAEVVGSGIPASQLTAVGSTLYLASTGGPVGSNTLWKSDANGTAAVRTFVPTTPGAPLSGLRALGGKLYFLGDDGQHGREPWFSDPATGTTQLIKDIATQTRDSSPNRGVELNGKTYFTAADPELGGELFVSDGTAGGTRLFYDAWPGPNSGGAGSEPLARVGDWIYFRANDGVNGFSLFRTNGTTIELIKPGVNPSRLIALANLLFFNAPDPVHGTRPWVSDGTPSGTRLLTEATPEFTPPGGSAFVSNSIGGYVYVSAGVGEIWRTNGTITLNFTQEMAVAGAIQPSEPIAAGDKLYFTAFEGPGGPTRLWVSDGGSTRVVANSAGTSFAPYTYIDVAGTLFF